jgi:hypothetical protein
VNRLEQVDEVASKVEEVGAEVDMAPTGLDQVLLGMAIRTGEVTALRVIKTITIVCTDLEPTTPQVMVDMEDKEGPLRWAELGPTTAGVPTRVTVDKGAEVPVITVLMRRVSGSIGLL